MSQTRAFRVAQSTEASVNDVPSWTLDFLRLGFEEPH